MSDTVQNLNILNKKIEKLQMEEHRQEGVRSQLLKDLKDQFDVETEEAAEELKIALETELVLEEESLTQIAKELQEVVDNNA